MVETDSERKAAILSRVRRSLGAEGQDELRVQRARERIAAHRPELVPKRGDVPLEERIALFTQMMERASASVQRVGSMAELPGAVAAFLKDNNLPARARMGADQRLRGVDWSTEPLLEIADGRAAPDDQVGLSAAFSAVAESGTLILTSGEDNPTSLNFLPETHIVVVAADEIEGNYEASWEKLRQRYGGRQMPRVVNMISGPSRTGDIEQTILLGAHGPKQLHVIVVG